MFVANVSRAISCRKGIATWAKIVALISTSISELACLRWKIVWILSRLEESA
jgi:hypothetical protein